MRPPLHCQEDHQHHQCYLLGLVGPEHLPHGLLLGPEHLIGWEHLHHLIYIHWDQFPL